MSYHREDMGFGWCLMICSLLKGLFDIAYSIQYACIGEDVLLSCPEENNVNSWQKVDTGDMLAICENGKMKINKSILDKLSITGSCNKLSIMNFTKDDAGKYSCFTIRKEKAQFKKYSLEIKLRIKPNVSIMSSPRSQIGKGHRLKLLCLDRCYDDRSIETFSWTHNGKILPNKTNGLLFKNADAEIAGEYSCTVNNGAAEDSDSINITVTCKPEMPRNVQIIALYNTIIVTWQTSHNGGTQQTLFIEYKKYFELEWKSVPIEDKTSTTIEGLQMDTVYVVRMFSKTSVGESNKTGEIIVKTGKPNSVTPDGSWKISITTGVTVVVFLVFLSGIKDLTRRYCLKIASERNNESQINDTLVRHGARYDEIDSVYYIPATGSSRTDPIVDNTPIEIMLSVPNNGRDFENTETVDRNSNDEFASGENTPCRSSEHVSSASSSEESYLKPCRKYINLEIFGNGEQNELERGQENHVEGSSVSSSEGSETHIKTDQKYETLMTPSVVVYSYESIVDTY